MGKMVMALKKLGKKLTGKTINNDNTVGVINEIADKYEGGGSALYLHSIKLPAYNNSYGIMSVVLPFDTPITKENFQDLLLPYIEIQQSGPTTEYMATGEGYWLFQGSARTFNITGVSFARKNYGTTIQLKGLGMNSSNVFVSAYYTVVDEITDIVKELA